MQTGTSRRASLALCAAVAASAYALTPVSSRACTVDFGATASAAAGCPTTGGSMCLCGKGAKTAALSAPAPANLVLASDLSADAAGPRVAAVTVSPAATTTVTTTSFPTTAFISPDVTINKGDTVQWVVNDNFHTVTRSAGPEAFDSGLISPGGTFSHTFSQAGVFEYECLIHFGMVGTVTVLDTAVPEPAAALLVAAGSTVAALRRRRRAVC